MKKSQILLILFVFIFGSAFPQCWEIFQYPGYDHTSAYDIDNGNTVGSYYNNSENINYGYIYDGSSFTQLNYSNHTYARGIDGDNVVGYYQGADAVPHGFKYNNFTYTDLDYPGSYSTTLMGIDGNYIVGFYQPASGNQAQGCMFDGTNWTTLNYPGSNRTEIYAIHGDILVGYYDNASWEKQGFMYNKSTSTWTTIDYQDQTYCYGVNATYIVGYTNNNHNNRHCFYYDIANGTFTEIDQYPGTWHSLTLGIDDNNVICGLNNYSTYSRGFNLIIAPTVTTQAVDNISAMAARGNGNITDLGIDNPSAHGVCWSTSSGPTVDDDFSNEGSASTTGAFTTDMTGLTPSTTYYVKAYATSPNGCTAYGDEAEFTTGEAFTLTLSSSDNNAWNNAVVNLYVDGSLTLSKTIEWWEGPESYYFDAQCGQVITTVYVNGNWDWPNEYTIKDPSGTIVAQSGQDWAVPGNIE